MNNPGNSSIRGWRADDMHNLAKYANNPHIARNLTNAFPYPYTIDDAQSFIAMAMSHNPIRIFAIALGDEAIGGIGLHPQSDIHMRNAELGYWLAEPFWGKGIATVAIGQIVSYGFKNFAIDRIFARPFGSNLGSQRVLEKNGFVLEARLKHTIFKNDTYEDELIYAVRP